MESNPFQAASAVETASPPAEPVSAETVVESTPPPPYPETKKKSSSGRFIFLLFLALIAAGGWFGYKKITSVSADAQASDSIVGGIVSKIKGMVPLNILEEPVAIPSVAQSPLSTLASTQPNGTPAAAPLVNDPTIPKNTPNLSSSAVSPTIPANTLKHTPPVQDPGNIPTPAANSAPPAIADSPKPAVAATTPSGIATTSLEKLPEPEKVATPVLTKPPAPEVDPISLLEKKLEAEPDSPASLYLKLASTYTSRGEKDKAETLLKGAHDQYPLEADITLALAGAYSSQNLNERAWTLIARTGRIGDLKFASRLLQLGLDSGKYDETLVILDPSFTGDLPWSSADRLKFAQLHEKVKNYGNAIRLYQDLPDGQTHILRVQAKEAHSKDDYTSALKHQSQYVNQLTAPDPEAWTFYADLHHLAGNNHEADEAYKKALAELKKRDALKG